MRNVRGRSLTLVGVASLALALGGRGAGPAHADIVTTRDGTVYEGKVLIDDAEKVVIETTFDGTRTVPKGDVRSIDTRKPPLRDQLAFRTKSAGADAKALWDVVLWARKAGFRDEVRGLLDQVVAADPNHRKAREALGHTKVDGAWMTPEEAARRAAAAEEAALRAKGLVPYEGEWITPEEKDARERGLRRDGSDWVTEEEWHRRRGERLIDGAWVRFGESEGKAFADLVAKGSRVPMTYRWSPWFDLIADVPAPLVETIATGSGKALAVARSVLKPEGDDFPDDDPEQRIRVFLNEKLPAYSRVATWFSTHVKADDLVSGWAGSVTRQHAWWWVQEVNAVGCYQFPNTDKVFVSNTVHQIGKLLLTIYKRDYRFPRPWLAEGFAYHLEMEALGYSETFALGRGGGSMATGEDTDIPVWADSAKWRGALRTQVDAGVDPPLTRLVKMDLGQFRYVELVKSWSVVECLVRWDPVRFKKFIDLTKGESADEEAALQGAFGVNFRALDDLWRAYVKAGYVHAK